MLTHRLFYHSIVFIECCRRTSWCQFISLFLIVIILCHLYHLSRFFWIFNAAQCDLTFPHSLQLLVTLKHSCNVHVVFATIVPHQIYCMSGKFKRVAKFHWNMDFEITCSGIFTSQLRRGPNCGSNIQNYWVFSLFCSNKELPLSC